MRVIRWSLDHPQAVLAFYAGLVLLAALALFQWIPVRLTPALPSSTLAVLTESMGLPPAAVERYVTTPLERQLFQVEGVRSVRSRSTWGMSTVLCDFPPGTDLTLARSRLQSAAPESRVLEFDPLNLPVVRLAVRAPRAYLEQVVVPRLKRLPEVDTAYCFGGSRTAEVMVDRDKLAAAGLTMRELQAALTTPRTGGAMTDLRGGQQPVSPAPAFPTLRELGATLVGPRLRLEQVAAVANVPGPSRYRYNGQEAVELNVVARPGASSPRVVAAVRASLAGLDHAVAWTNAHFVTLVARDVWLELGLAIILTGAVVFFFTRDRRATAIALATIPTSLAFALVGFVPLGLSLNSSTLVGLLLAIGRLVDDTIIDLDAVRRHRLLGKSPRQAALDGCTEVRRAVISSTSVIVLGMLPLTLAGGVVQSMFEGIVWPYILALLASLAVALTLTPVLCAWGLAAEPRPLDTVWERRYEAALGRPVWWAAAVLYVGLMLYPLIGSEMMPLSDTSQLYVVLEAPAGTGVPQTARLAEKVEAILRRQPEVVAVSTEVGTEPVVRLTGYEGMTSSTATMLVTLRDGARRSAWEVADAVNDEARRTVAGLRRLTLKEMGSDVMASSMAPVELVLKGPDLPRLSWLAERTAELATAWGRAHPGQGLSQVATAWSLDGQGWEVTLHEGRGLTPLDVWREVGLALEGGPSGVALADGTPVMLGYREAQRQGFRDLERVRVGAFRLGEVASIRSVPVTDAIDHDNLQRCNTVMGSYRPGGPGSMGLSMGLLMASRMQLPYPAGYELEQRGDMVAMMDSFRRLLLGLAAALPLIYLALVAQLGSWRAPLAILVAVPLSLPGVFAALLLAGQTFSTVSLLGLVILAGMDVTASILLVDALRAGLPASVRLRPLLLTAGVTIAVMLPAALFPRAGLDAYSPLATVVVGGLLSSTLLSLFVVPTVYRWLEGNSGGSENVPQCRN